MNGLDYELMDRFGVYMTNDGHFTVEVFTRARDVMLATGMSPGLEIGSHADADISHIQAAADAGDPFAQVVLAVAAKRKIQSMGETDGGG